MFKHFYSPSKPFTDYTEKSDFANYCCQLLYLKYNGNLKDPNFLNELKTLFLYFREFVRNIYEMDDEIPLFAYHLYIDKGWDETRWDISETNETDYVTQLHEAIQKYYVN